jgi:hypothetical protein
MSTSAEDNGVPTPTAATPQDEASDGPFQRATRWSRPARLAVAGPSGSGRTGLALETAEALGGRILVIDTEGGRAERYADRFTFDHLVPTLFDPVEQLRPTLIQAAAGRYEVLVIDSYSAYWSGKGGLLDRVDQDAERTGNKQGGWRANRPMDRAVAESLWAYPGHVIITLRSHVEYLVGEDAEGVKCVHRVALKPDQRPSLEYEVDLFVTMLPDFRAIVDKSSVPALVGRTLDNPGGEISTALRDWLATGKPAPSGFDLLAGAMSPDATLDSLGQIETIASEHRFLDMAAYLKESEGKFFTLGDLLGYRKYQLRQQQRSRQAAQTLQPEPRAASPDRVSREPASDVDPAAGHPHHQEAQSPENAKRQKALEALFKMAHIGWKDLATVRAAYKGAEEQDLLDEPVPGQEEEGGDLSMGQWLTRRLERS